MSTRARDGHCTVPCTHGLPADMAGGVVWWCGVFTSGSKGGSDMSSVGTEPTRPGGPARLSIRGPWYWDWIPHGHRHIG